MNNGKRISQYTCAEYSKVPIGTRCPTQHRINESVVLELIADMLRAIAEYAKVDKEDFIKTVCETQEEQQNNDIKKKKHRLEVAQKRQEDLERLICKIYEDNALGKLSDIRYSAMESKYAQEQEKLAMEIKELESAVNKFDVSRKSAEQFFKLIDKYHNFETLTNTMLNEFVEKILVHERARKGSIQSSQEIEIYFNFVGKYVPPHFGEVNLTEEEKEALRKREEIKDKRHQEYLKRKASGWQRKYDERTKAAKKAKIDSMKAAIWAEDMEKGVFIPVGNLPVKEPQIALVNK